MGIFENLISLKDSFKRFLENLKSFEILKKKILGVNKKSYKDSFGQGKINVAPSLLVRKKNEGKLSIYFGADVYLPRRLNLLRLEPIWR